MPLFSRSPCAQIVHCNITPQGMLVPFFGARDLVIQRSWRVEEDETYVVTMNSVDHPLCPPPPQKKGLGWFTSPVRAQVRQLVRMHPTPAARSGAICARAHPT